jgi:hypothetical protein
MIPVTTQISLSSALLNSDFYEVRSTLWLLGIKEKELDRRKRLSWRIFGVFEFGWSLGGLEG